jgi:hypothetical protein
LDLECKEPRDLQSCQYSSFVRTFFLLDFYMIFEQLGAKRGANAHPVGGMKKIFPFLFRKADFFSIESDNIDIKKTL